MDDQYTEDNKRVLNSGTINTLKDSLTMSLEEQVKYHSKQNVLMFAAKHGLYATLKRLLIGLI